VSVWKVSRSEIQEPTGLFPDEARAPSRALDLHHERPDTEGVWEIYEGPNSKFELTGLSGPMPRPAGLGGSHDL